MKTVFLAATMLGPEFFAFTVRGGTKLLTTDPLTGLPLHPATDSRHTWGMSLLSCRNRSGQSNSEPSAPSRRGDSETRLRGGFLT